jgi:hypothetical protein
VNVATTLLRSCPVPARVLCRAVKVERKEEKERDQRGGGEKVAVEGGEGRRSLNLLECKVGQVLLGGE